jgi:hypothetical protein
MNFPKAKLTSEIVSGKQTARNIALQLKRAILESKSDALTIKDNFKGKSKYITCFNVWEFCRNNIKYKRESGDLQTAKTIARIWHDRNTGGDCKHFTTFCCSILSSLGIPCEMRMISQNFYNSDPTHIYCVAYVNGKEVIVDPCLKSFDNEAQYKYKYNLAIK